MTPPRVMALCKFTCPEEYWKQYPFNEHQVFCYLGEITNMPGHGIFLDIRTGQVYSCYHIDNFVELSDDEV